MHGNVLPCAPLPRSMPRCAVRAVQVTTVREASLWLSYTYLYTRMTQNPLAYGVGWEELAADPRLEGHRCAPL